MRGTGLHNLLYGLHSAKMSLQYTAPTIQISINVDGFVVSALPMLTPNTECGHTGLTAGFQNPVCVFVVDFINACSPLEWAL